MGSLNDLLEFGLMELLLLLLVLGDAFRDHLVLIDCLLGILAKSNEFIFIQTFRCDNPIDLLVRLDAFLGLSQSKLKGTFDILLGLGEVLAGFREGESCYPPVPHSP